MQCTTAVLARTAVASTPLSSPQVDIHINALTLRSRKCLVSSGLFLHHKFTDLFSNTPFFFLFQPFLSCGKIYTPLWDVFFLFPRPHTNLYIIQLCRLTSTRKKSWSSDCNSCWKTVGHGMNPSTGKYDLVLKSPPNPCAYMRSQKFKQKFTQVHNPASSMSVTQHWFKSWLKAQIK